MNKTFKVMASCAETARRLGSTIAPAWDSRTMRKNRKALDMDNLANLFKSNIVHLYILCVDAPHECIIFRVGDYYVICDSYIDYRDISVRIYQTKAFQSKFCDILTVKTKVSASARDLFHPPTNLSTEKVSGWFSVLK
jgi:hypothetical protein